MTRPISTSPERGSALLLTLGILSFVMMIALSFAFSARTGRTIAKSAADQVQVRLLAESALERIQAQMRAEWKIYTDSDYSYYPILDKWGLYAENADTPYSQFYAIEKIAVEASPGDPGEGEEEPDFQERSFGDLLVVAWDPAFYYAGILDQAGFVEVEDSDDNLIGRYGYLLLEEAAKLDFNRLVTRRKNDNAPKLVKSTEFPYCFKTTYDDNPGTEPEFVFNLTEDETTKNQIDEENTLRLGKHAQEIRAPKNVVDIMDESEGERRLPWLSHEHLLAKLDMTMTDLDYPLQRFRFFSIHEPDAFFDPDGFWTPDGETPVPGKIYDRFDLSGTEWGNNWNAIEPTNFANEQPHPFTLSPENADNNAAVGIPYLGKIKDKADVPVGTHVAANLIDYCDADDIATVDAGALDKIRQFIAGNASTKLDQCPEPAYCGNESVPYFNELKATFHVSRRLDEDTRKYQLVLDQDFEVEFANVFNDIAGDDLVDKLGDDLGAYLGIQCEFSVSWNGEDAAYVETNFRHGSFHQKIKDEDWDDGDEFLTVKLPRQILALAAFQDEPIVSQTADVSGNLITTYYPKAHDNVKLKLKIVAAYMALTNDEAGDEPLIYDLAFCKPANPVELAFTFSLPGVTSDNIDEFNNYENNYHKEDGEGKVTIDDSPDISYWFLDTVETPLEMTMEAEDPRCNHRSKYWKIQGNNAGTIGKINSNYEVNDDAAYQHDLEENQGTTIKVSTAYIRNNNMKSLWELGAIHRAEPHRTIRLTHFASPSDAKFGAYDHGDAIILDQVKFGPQKSTVPALNANTRNNGVWLELLNGIDWTDNYNGKLITPPPANPDDPKEKFNYSNWLATTTIDNSWFTETWFQDLPSPFRGATATMMREVANKLNAKNDREQEAFIGRTANLLTTRSDYYTLAIVAQQLQEMKDMDKDTFLAIRDTLTNPTIFKVAGNERFCSVLATQAVLAHLHRDAWLNKFTVIQTRFLDR